jgi:hypothetical protein
VDRLESFSNVARVESDQRILPYFRAVDGFRLDLLNRAFSALLRKTRNA